MICASRPVPSVVTTNACVSPRVNNAEPWVRASTPGADGDRPDGLGVAAVDARMSLENALAHQPMFQIEEFRADFFLGEFRRVAARQRFEHGVLDLADLGVTLLLLGQSHTPPPDPSRQRC